MCKPESLEFVEDSVRDKKQVDAKYDQVEEVGFDHSSGEIKFSMKKDAAGESSQVIFQVPDSVEFERELRLRFTSMAQRNASLRIPTIGYVGMFAGATKPKPFQRKRPNISKIPTGKLPPLGEMRGSALDFHSGSYKPCPPGHSRRMDLAVQHIYDGYNTFPVTYVRGQVTLANQWRLESLLLITESKIVFRPTGISGTSVDIPFSSIERWSVVDNEKVKKNDSGLDVHLHSGDYHYFGVPHIRDVKHTFEFFWNKYRLLEHLPVKIGSTHGRPLETITTLMGEVPAPRSVPGNLDMLDQDGSAVRPGAIRPVIAAAPIAPASGLVGVGLGAVTGAAGLLGAAVTSAAVTAGVASNEPPRYPMETIVRGHWKDVVKHQGWLLKKGGLGVGSAKQWIKRYFVLYSTSQGHFMSYYSDITDCPLYSNTRSERNLVDCAKTTFIRPGSTKSDPDTPPNCFDIVTIEREWTLCAETHENAARWLQMLTRAVDEDVAIIPDEDLVFKVKPKVDPTGNLNQQDYSTTLKVSANAVTLMGPDPQGGALGADKEYNVWIYTDFYKWSLLSQNGKLALLINVFVDSTFSKRMEFVFRSTEAVRLATAIEFYIEKFMTCMHIRLEGGEIAGGGAGGGDEEPQPSRAAAPPRPQAAPVVKEVNLLDMGDDFLPMSPTTKSAGPPPVPTAPSGGGFSGDFDFFGDSAPAAPAAPARIALTADQVSQHATWLQSAFLTGSGPIYDDGNLQIACTVEIRGSQGRLTFQVRCRVGISDATELSIQVVDSAGLLRFEAGQIPPVLAAGAQASLQIMVECMKPIAPGPSLQIKYRNRDGLHDNKIDIPVIMSSFNEPLQINGADFMQRWEKLKAGGTESVEVFNPATAINPSFARQAVLSALKFGRVEGLPDISDTVFYGAASLRTGALGPNGDKISVGCMIKIEINVHANAVRATCRTLHPAATAALMQNTKSILS